MVYMVNDSNEKLYSNYVSVRQYCNVDSRISQKRIPNNTTRNTFNKKPSPILLHVVSCTLLMLTC